MKLHPLSLFLVATAIVATACDGGSDSGPDRQRAASKTCNVKTVKDAKACIAALDIPEFEEPNSIGVVAATKKTRERFQRVLNGLVEVGLKDTDDGFFSALEAAAEADFLAVVNQHTDEEQLFYFFLFKGKKVRANEFFEFSVAEIDPYPISVLPLDWALGNEKIEGWHYDSFEEAFQNAPRRR